MKDEGGRIISGVKPLAGDSRFTDLPTVKMTIVLFWAVFALYLLAATYAPSGITSSKWFGIPAKAAIRLTAALWVYADGRARNLNEGRLRKYLVFSIALMEITVPIYLVKTRGWMGAAQVSLRFIGYLALAAVIFVALDGGLKIFGINAV